MFRKCQQKKVGFWLVMLVFSSISFEDTDVRSFKVPQVHFKNTFENSMLAEISGSQMMDT